MASYVVMRPPAERGAEPMLIRDGFALLGFVVPPLWLLWHRLWFEAAIAFGLMLAIPALASALGNQMIGGWLSLLVSVFIGLEGSALRLAAYRRRGWKEAGVFEADNLEDAETRFDAESGYGPSTLRAA